MPNISRVQGCTAAEALMLTIENYTYYAISATDKYK